MYDSDVFAVITAHDQDNQAASALELVHNSKWFQQAAGGIASEPTVDSRETTAGVDSQSDEENGIYPNRLVLLFSKLLALDNLENGLQLGTDPILSHIQLSRPGTKGISGRQCNITVDEDLKIWLHDYYSWYGTAVGHNGQNQDEVRRNETWFLTFAPGDPNPFKETTIHCNMLAIRIQFPNHVAGKPRYVENLRAFLKKCQEAAKRSKFVEGHSLDSEPGTGY
ncbi:MAG: hypothetical protein Q9163_001166, partial [Psora crenata]